MLARNRGGQAGEVLQAIGAGDDVDNASFLYGFAGIAGFELREFIVPCP